MSLDPRIHPVRDDLAAAYLKDRLAAPRYAEGVPRQVTACAAPLREAPAHDARLASEALFGERVTVYEEKDGWAWLQADRDGYVGYAPADTLTEPGPPATHRVQALHTFLHPRPDLKTPPEAVLPMTAEVALTGREEAGYAETAGGGWVFAGHLAPLDAVAGDVVAVAEKFLGVPYLWGGKTSRGLDCSGLVQTALIAAGHDGLRDTDMQRESIGESIDIDAPRRRGDIVFFPGHVGIMRDADTLIHANAWSMNVAAEALSAVVSRLAQTHAEPVTAVRRP